MTLNLHEAYQKLTTGELAGWAVVLLILLFSLIQISPLKLNPWDSILGWIGKKLNGGVTKQMDKLQKQTQDIWINTHRQTLLSFARECRHQVEHSADEWTYVLNVADEYEQYCDNNGVANGVVRADTRFIRELYHELSREHRI